MAIINILVPELQVSTLFPTKELREENLLGQRVLVKGESFPYAVIRELNESADQAMVEWYDSQGRAKRDRYKYHNLWIIPTRLNELKILESHYQRNLDLIKAQVLWTESQNKDFFDEEEWATEAMLMELDGADMAEAKKIIRKYFTKALTNT